VRPPSSWPPDLGYYHEGWWLASNPGFRGKVGSSHRMLSTYLNSLAGHGLALERAAEPPPDAAWRQRLPGAAGPALLRRAMPPEVRPSAPGGRGPSQAGGQSFATMVSTSYFATEAPSALVTSASHRTSPYPVPSRGVICLHVSVTVSSSPG
jgi:hypothetical protein